MSTTVHPLKFGLGTAAAVDTPIPVADGGTGAETPAAAREALGLARMGTGLYHIFAPVAAGNYTAPGFGSAAGTARASAAPITRGQRLCAPSSPAANTDGSIIGGFNTEANNRVFFTSSTSRWTAYFFFGTNADASIRGGAGMSNANFTDVDKLANNSIGVRHRPATAAGFYAVCTDNAGTTITPVSLGVSPAANKLYVVEIQFNGTAALVRMALVNEATGAWGTWSTQATLSSNLPLSTAGLAPTQCWWCVGTPGTTPVVDVGGATILPYLFTSTA